MLLDRIIAQAKELDINTIPTRAVIRLYGIGYNRSWAAFLIDQMETALGITPDSSHSLDERLFRIKCETNPVLDALAASMALAD